MKNKQLHKRIEDVELAKGEQVSKSSGELSDSIPVLDYLNDNFKLEKSTRRDFLKTMGFSISAAALAASCDTIPVKRAIPYLDRPVGVTPGQALYYASSYFDGRNFSNILVKTRDGRPIKIEPNKSNPLRTSTNATTQSSLIGLYDHTRVKHPYFNNEAISWEDADQQLKSHLTSNGGSTVILTGPVIEQGLRAAISLFAEKYNAKHVVYSPHGADAVLRANEAQFGKNAVPMYRFANADVIASFGADFLGSWLGGSSFYAKDYAQNRKVSESNPHMSKHYQVESHMSLTGSNADKRKTVKPSQIKAALVQLHNRLASQSGGATITSNVQALPNEWVNELANDLLSNRGKSIVLCGLNDLEAQKITNAINQLLGNYGSTISFDRTLNTIQGTSSDLSSLIAEMNSGSVGVLLLHEVNPVFNSPKSAAFSDAFTKVKTIAAFDSSLNETNEKAHMHLPDHHYLESWAVFEPVTGNVSLAQPTIRPIFETRNFTQSLLTLAEYDFGGEGKDYVDFLQTQFGGGLEAWQNAVKTGGVHSESVEATGQAFTSTTLTASVADESDMELVLFEDKIGDGSQANNPYLQELPDPVSKISWGNYAAVSPSFAKQNNWDFDRNINPAKKSSPIVTITANGQSVELPILVQPGIAHGVFAIPKGYGRTVSGLVGDGVGVSVNALVASEAKGDFTVNYLPVSSVDETGKKYKLANSQVHYSIDDDRPTVRETTLEHYKENPKSGNQFRHLDEFQHAIEPTLYPEREFPAHHWGMSVDLNSCFGCGACVVACNIENNIPVVGQEEMANAREMHWLRIDRYFASENQDPNSDTYMEDPSVVFMPMMCQHCDNAPCENVCPVNATNHSTEGLNQMAYNRCIGTRYCANNCPFKVRRFNWFDYWGADAWGGGNDLRKNEINENMRNDYSRMILNPDVTVRSRGVIEKCSFCVQRIQQAKLDAKVAGNEMAADAIQTACQSACPADAIVFGDTNNMNSQVHNQWNDARNYFVLEEFHIKPSVGYMTKVTNSDLAKFDKTDLEEFPWKESEHEGGDVHGQEHGGHEESHSSEEQHQEESH